MESNSAFQEALQRAKQLAAKISQPTGIKRPNEDDGDPENSPDTKKLDLGLKPAPTMMNPAMNQMNPMMMKNPNPNPPPNPNNNNNGPPRPPRDQVFLNGTMFNGEKVLDMMVPGNKVGIVIGKGGDMIRNLQEQAGVKMIIYQDSTEISEREKQLRISGDPVKVDQAKTMVMQLLADKEREMMQRKNKVNTGGMNAPAVNEFRPSPGQQMTYLEYPVSPQLIGLVIGKGGETIRKIQTESGCKVQFDTLKVDPQGNKICQFSGAQEAVNRALNIVREIIDAASQGQGNMEEIRIVVPANKTGSVIGRGGETIRGMKVQSGCNIELDKTFESQQNNEKCFIIRGPAEKIPYAQQMIADKVGGQVTVLSSTLPNNALQYNAGGYNVGGTPMYPGLNQVGQSGAGGQSQYYWPNLNADEKTIQEQYMYAAYYGQFYGQPQMAANGGSAAMSIPVAQDVEMVYKQWIEYYKFHGLTKEAEALEQKLREYNSNANSNNNNRNDDDGGGNGAAGSSHGHGSGRSHPHPQNGKVN